MELYALQNEVENHGWGSMNIGCKSVLEHTVPLDWIRVAIASSLSGFAEGLLNPASFAFAFETLLGKKQVLNCGALNDGKWTAGAVVGNELRDHSKQH